MCYWLLSRISPVIVFTQHLIILYVSFAALVPRGNVVGFHFRNIKLLSAEWTIALLPFCCLSTVWLSPILPQYMVSIGSSSQQVMCHELIRFESVIILLSTSHAI